MHRCVILWRPTSDPDAWNSSVRMPDLVVKRVERKLASDQDLKKKLFEST
jgi:hypothetical protein